MYTYICIYVTVLYLSLLSLNIHNDCLNFGFSQYAKVVFLYEVSFETSR